MNPAGADEVFGKILINQGSPLKSPPRGHSEGVKRLKHLKPASYLALLRMTKRNLENSPNIYAGAMQILPSGGHRQFPHRTGLE
jgi:hypothetical protein